MRFSDGKLFYCNDSLCCCCGLRRWEKRETSEVAAAAAAGIYKDCSNSSLDTPQNDEKWEQREKTEATGHGDERNALHCGRANLDDTSRKVCSSNYKKQHIILSHFLRLLRLILLDLF